MDEHLASETDDDRPPKKEPDEECNARRFDNGSFVGYCNRCAGWGTDHVHEGRCKSHGGNGGAPEGNQNAVGEHDIDQDGNTNAMRHGMYMTIKRKYEAFQRNFGEGAGEFYRERLEEFEQKCDNFSQAESLATLRSFNALLQQQLINEEFETAYYTDDGTRYKALDTERFGEIKSLQTETRLGLHYEGVSNTSGSSSSAHGNASQLTAGDGGGGE